MDRPAGRRVATTNGNKGDRPRSWQGVPGQGRGRGRRQRRRRAERRPGPARRARSPAAALPGRGLPARSRHPADRSARPATAPSFRQRVVGPDPGSPEIAPPRLRRPPARGSRSRPSPGFLSNFLGRGALGRGVGSRPAGLQRSKQSNR